MSATGEEQWAALGRSPYVRLTTFRRTGEPVGTAVWWAPDLADPSTRWVTTTAGTGKVKRLRHTPRALLVACDRAGRVAPGAAEVEGVGEVVDDPATARPRDAALRAKYGLQLAVVDVAAAASGVWRRVRGRPRVARVGIRLRPVDGSGGAGA